MSIWKDGKPLFAGDKYADLSDEAAVFHRWHSQACQDAERLTNPSTNSYKRLIPGSRPPSCAPIRPQPVGCIRIPWTESHQGQACRGALPRPVGPTLYPGLRRAVMAGLDASRTRSTPATRPTRISTICRPRNWPAPDRLRVAARGAREPASDHGLPAQRATCSPRPDRRLHGAEVGRGLRLRTHAAPDRIQDVLQLLIPSSHRYGNGRPRAPVSALAAGGLLRENVPESCGFPPFRTAPYAARHAHRLFRALRGLAAVGLLFGRRLAARAAGHAVDARSDAAVHEPPDHATDHHVEESVHVWSFFDALVGLQKTPTTDIACLRPDFTGLSRRRSRHRRSYRRGAPPLGVILEHVAGADVVQPFDLRPVGRAGFPAAPPRAIP